MAAIRLHTAAAAQSVTALGMHPSACTAVAGRTTGAHTFAWEGALPGLPALRCFCEVDAPRELRVPRGAGA